MHHGPAAVRDHLDQAGDDQLALEPARLRQTHGEPYERYFKAVPALFPTLKPYPEGASIGWSSDRMLRNREHWMVIGLLVISAFMLWRSHSLE